MPVESPSILVVDDDRMLARSLGDILRIHGFASKEAYDATAGLDLIRESDPFAVALVDLRLPDMDGIELVSRVHELAVLTEIIILTGNASLDSAVAALRERSCDYLIKPVEPDELLSTVRRGVRRWQQRSAEEELGRDRERFQQVIEALSDVVMVLAPDGRIDYQSPPAERILGLRPDVMAGTSFLSHVHPADREGARGALEDARGARLSTRPFEFRFRRAGDDWCLFEGAARTLTDDEGASIVLACRDITERRRLEHELRQSQKLDSIGRLAGGIAHDFNNQLTVILTSTNLAFSEVDVPDPVREELEEIREAARRAATLTHQLLLFSRNDVAEPQRIDVGLRVQGMFKMLRRLIPENIELEVARAESTASVLIDPTQLEQVVVNLVVNARDAVDPGGRIVLDVFETEVEEESGGELPQGCYVTIQVTDDGAGMTEAVQSRVFEPFFTTKEKGRGTGLGLATSYGIVTGVGGHIRVTSRIGEGSTFEVLLPSSGRIEADGGPTTRGPPARSEGGTIILIEDEPAVRRGIAKALEGAGYRVLPAANAHEAMGHAADPATHIDIILSDLVMPGLTGPEIVEAVRGVRPDLPALFISGYADREVLGPGAVPPGSEVLRKPIETEELVARIEETLARSRE